jgi:hypothetical protein
MAQAETYSTRPAPALHLLGGVWIASCPTCGFELCSGRDQQHVERWARWCVCDVCEPEDAA